MYQFITAFYGDSYTPPLTLILDLVSWNNQTSHFLVHIFTFCYLFFAKSMILMLLSSNMQLLAISCL
ncbi:hypothetical protein AQUCO_00900379v1 [Aquilegia coerulea]|uniref:Uncharacterized protein n=1 Tax=Aquilegia coerulea TaxID=218851 RepID=A0A2G5EDX9_AQUCA|nr:hypothetical protein AQUCO_00900379v1 [Aquilegia coerulea]